MARILITIPTYNEAVVIERSLREIQAKVQSLLSEHEVTIEVVDNGSTDGTAEIVRRLVGAQFIAPSGRHADRSADMNLPTDRPNLPVGKPEGVMNHAPTVHLIELREKGKGLAIRRSWERHLTDADVLLFTDADLAADLSALPLLIQPILAGEADFVCGSRFMAGSGVERRWTRELASRLFRIFQHRLLGLPVEDAQCGFKAISAESCAVLLPQCQENGWLLDSELLAQAVRAKIRIREIPVSWIEQRDPGRRSALKLYRDGWSFLLGLAKIRWRIFG